MLLSYLPIIILILLATGFALGTLFVSHMLGPRRPTPAKAIPYECGIDPVGSARQRFSVKFYLVAMLFIVFDIEIVFLYPWAVTLNSLKLFGLVEMVLFLGILLIGLVYVWKKGGLEWVT
ncbi:MAG: NADH-quinone oxidoreductase subunit A [Candidatus Methylomirabilota bacterium]|nr:NADH-quinone oxidoreductase subunit A [Candidatus Methylomirabilis sp.]NJD69522.1 NADH-quinone oxidoreductase subunit A [candidate division NC10 bacterium]PWB48602.1 MAG: NADH-quinone oxidoreductase subunit A [candidate division NC10 bacterium]